MSIFTLPLRLAVAKTSAILYTEFRKEEQDMIFIGGISSAVKQLEYLKTVICSVCGSYGRYQVYMTYTYFSFFFIPLFKWNRKFYVKMTCCGSVYELDRETGMKILRGQAADIGESDLSLMQRGTGNFAEEGSCPDCGCRLSEDFSYCPQCGRKL